VSGGKFKPAMGAKSEASCFFLLHFCSTFHQGGDGGFLGPRLQDRRDLGLGSLSQDAIFDRKALPVTWSMRRLW
jgi:hypothetical protein